jgi:5-methylcytosine-specific restriction endonuclease McrA
MQTHDKYGGICGKCYRKQPADKKKVFARILPTKKTKVNVLRRDFGGALDGQCFVCGDMLLHENIEFGHIIPSSKGGSVEEDNLHIICRSCNSEMSDENLYEFMKRKYIYRYNLALSENKILFIG